MRDFLWGASAAACLAVGVAIGWWIWGQPPAPVRGEPGPAQRQDDGSLVLERGPIVDNIGALLRPHDTPRGARVERQVRVDVQPKAEACPALRVDLSLLRLPDGTGRVVASSPDGRVTGGLDLPVLDERVADERQRWASGVSYAGDQAWGVFVHRDVWRVRFGLEINALREDGAEARAMIGWTW